MVSRRFLLVFKTLLVMIVGLMALGAGVRSMNAGLACPDWPLCFGQVIPDFHVGVYFEFIHRAYAGLVALVFFGCFVYLQRKPVPTIAKILGWVALLLLTAQIVMGGLTVLKLLKAYIVTSHLVLATLFFATLLWTYFTVRGQVERPTRPAPLAWGLGAGVLPGAVLAQLVLGGFVASTYAGLVCVDFPKCNGVWVPTWSGSIGLQVMHRFLAYAVGLLVILMVGLAQANRRKAWMTPQLLRAGWWMLGMVLLQISLGIGNVLLYIPAWMTVLHLTGAVLLLATTLRFWFLSRQLMAAGRKAEAVPVAFGQGLATGVSG